MYSKFLLFWMNTEAVSIEYKKKSLSREPEVIGQHTVLHHHLR